MCSCKTLHDTWQQESNIRWQSLTPEFDVLHDKCNISFERKLISWELHVGDICLKMCCFCCENHQPSPHYMHNTFIQWAKSTKNLFHQVFVGQRIKLSLTWLSFTMMEATDIKNSVLKWASVCPLCWHFASWCGTHRPFVHLPFPDCLCTYRSRVHADPC